MFEMLSGSRRTGMWRYGRVDAEVRAITPEEGACALQREAEV